MFIHNLHEDTKYYLKSLLVERRDSSKSKKDDKKDETPPVNQPPAVLPQSSEIVVPPTKTTLSQEEREKKEREQKAAEEKERQERTISSNMADAINTSVYPFKETTAATGGGIYRWGRSTRPDEELDTRAILPGSGRGRGAPAVTGEPSDATGMRYSKDKNLNLAVLIGQSAPQMIAQSPIKTVIDPRTNQPVEVENTNPLDIALEPYKGLQRLKLLKTFDPGIYQKIRAAKQVENASLEPAGTKPYTAIFKGATGNFNPNLTGTGPREQELKNHGINVLASVPSNAPQSIKDDIVNAAYEELKSELAPDKSLSNSLPFLVKRYTQSIEGLGGLDPYFTKELALKLLGGEWIEKAMQNIAPSAERGVISSMGHRGSIGM